MAVDDRYKRSSATALILPFLFTVHTDTDAAVDAAERMSATWMYNGIAAGEPPASVWTNILIEGINNQDGKYYQITGRYRER